ncbi:DUF262 domain-containing protein [Hyphomonas sp.]|uniref:DUF262 domain-containing protein n=1 Tax=Hyphomonas sp. TaxID=87 RepID=UPI003919D640
MTEFTISTMIDANVLALVDMRDRIDRAPDYQRPGGIWNIKKKQLFIDSLLNGYDVPKMYFHQLSGKHAHEQYRYSIIDGRQRVEAILEFVDGRFPLSDDFQLMWDDKIQAAGKTFDELQKDHPRLLIKFQSRSLAIQVVTAEDLDFIEDMFSRLNEAVPLNSAEKRNAFGGPSPTTIRALASHAFFKNKVRVSSSRYRHFDLATKMLYQEWSFEVASRHKADIRIVDTKRATLDYFVQNIGEAERPLLNDVVAMSSSVMDHLNRVFVDKDELLKSSGMVVVYYVLFSMLMRDGVADKASRRALVEFEERRAENRGRFEREEREIDFSLIEYDELAQSSNDASAIALRYRVLRDHLGL